MLRPKSTALLTAAAAAFSILLTAMPASARDTGAAADYGEVVQGSFDRQIEIAPNTKWANVTDGETIRFVVKNDAGEKQSFTYYFHAYTTGEDVVELSKIAPAGIAPARPVEVYIDAEPSARS